MTENEWPPNTPDAQESEHDVPNIDFDFEIALLKKQAIEDQIAAEHDEAERARHERDDDEIAMVILSPSFSYLINPMTGESTVMGDTESEDAQTICELMDDIRCLTEAGDDANNIADALGIPVTMAMAYGAKAKMRDYVVPIRYTVEGRLLVRAANAHDAISMVASQEEPNLAYATDCAPVPSSYQTNENPELIERMTRLWEEGKLQGPVTRTKIVSPAETIMTTFDDSGIYHNPWADGGCEEESCEVVMDEGDE